MKNNNENTIFMRENEDSSKKNIYSSKSIQKNYGSKIYKIFVIDLQIFHLFQIADIAVYHTMKHKQFKKLRP